MVDRDRVLATPVLRAHVDTMPLFSMFRGRRGRVSQGGVDRGG